ncbi:hypothetical protein [Rubripirellula tenax]|uniref:hypothetical protein n=1 Tax=Rubripirellula tenax TaxID=2528015 RepID=UPI0011B6F9BE|nr:hypothetical protein [Rubripirellula tenax]
MSASPCAKRLIREIFGKDASEAGAYKSPVQSKSMNFSAAVVQDSNREQGNTLVGSRANTINLPLSWIGKHRIELSTEHFQSLAAR